MTPEEKAKEYVNELYMQTIHLFKERGIAREGYLAGYTQALTDNKEETAQLREALRELVEDIDENKISWRVGQEDVYKTLVSPSVLSKVKTILKE